MPILKFQCGDCGKEFAKIFFDPGDAPRTCPVCGATGLREAGEAFEYDAESLERPACVSCEACEEQAAPCAVPVSS